jgi:hypothetical protein
MTRYTGQVTDEYDRPVPGALVYALKADGTYADLTEDGGAALLQPISTDDFGVWHYNTSDAVYTRDFYYGGKLRYRESVVDSPLDAGLRADLQATGGAALVGSDDGSTVQGVIDTLTGKAEGTLPSGSTNSLDVTRTAGGASDGTTQWYGQVHRIHGQGANNFDFVRESYAGTHGDGTGTIANLSGRHQYLWLTTNSATQAKVYEGHVRLDGPGDITGEVDVYRAVSTSLGVGGTINRIVAFSCGDIGHATQVTDAFALDIPDLVALASSIGVRSAQSAGSGKYFIAGLGDAQSVHLGKFKIGATTSPAEALDVSGNAKISGSLQVGGGTALTKIVAYAPSLTPASVAAATVAEQTFTVAGLTTADKVVVNPPSISNATGIAGARVSAADTLAVRFVNPTAGALTPTSGTYTVLAFRS